MSRVVELSHGLNVFAAGAPLRSQRLRITLCYIWRFISFLKYCIVLYWLVRFYTAFCLYICILVLCANILVNKDVNKDVYIGLYWEAYSAPTDLLTRPKGAEGRAG